MRMLGVGAVCVVALAALAVGCGSGGDVDDAGDGGFVVLASSAVDDEAYVLQEYRRTGRACVRGGGADVAAGCIPPIAAGYLQVAAQRLDGSRVLVYGRAPHGARELVIASGTRRQEIPISSSSRGFLTEVVTSDRRLDVEVRPARCRATVVLNGRGTPDAVRCE
jgi:hypothetical protein